MWRPLLGFLLLTAICGGDEPRRPKILGVAHMAIFVSDLAKARAFYKDFLGYDEPYSLKNKDGSDQIVFIKINEDQYLELFTDPRRDDGQLNHISFETDDANAMRDYLAAKGLKVPQTVGKGRIRNSNFNVGDPDGHTVEIVQYEPDSWTRAARGKFVPDTRISTRMMHIGVLIGPLERATKFYRDVLGFQEFWRGTNSPTMLSWVNMRVPDGQDYLEFMLYNKTPDDKERGTKNHICLMVPDMDKAVKTLEARPARKNYPQQIEIRTGVNRKRQANLYDPDGTRVELMEPNTVDGKPAAQSTAPPPMP
jgi:lactoylglutathione lyase